MKFGVAVPNCVEGMAYPIRFADHEAIIRLSVLAEQLGYEHVLVNDHLSTMPYVRDAFDDAPRFYEPLITLASIGAHTSTIRLMTGVIVVPMREPVMLAKQVATLDQFTGGRVTLGVGIGAYRAEFESVYPARTGQRGAYLDEGILSLLELFGERRASFDGEHFQFHDVEMYPKPAQTPFPILACGNAEETIRRAGQWCEGWIPAGLPADRIKTGVEQMHRIAEEAGRDPASLDVAPQIVLCIGRDEDEAMAKFMASQAYEHLMSLRKSTLRGIELDAFRTQNLIGSPAQILERVQRLGDAGAKRLAGMIVATDTEADYAAQIELFAAEVMPAAEGLAA